MDSNKKLKWRSTDISLPPSNLKWHQITITKVNKKCKEFLTNTTDGKIVNTNRVNNNSHNNEHYNLTRISGLECNQNNAPLTQFTADHPRSESEHLALHHSSKNSKNFLNMRPKSADKNNNNTNWQITYIPAPSENELCDICGQTFTFKCTLKRHVESMHGNKTYICPECNYQSPRVDNIRRHLWRYHKLIHTTALITNLQTVMTSITQAVRAPAATSSKIHKYQSQPKKSQNIIKMKLKPTLVEPITAAPKPKPKRFHTKPVTILPKRNHKISTPLNTTTTTLVESPIKDADTDLRDLSWLPTALSPQENEKELSTPILNATPVQDNWNIIDEIGTTKNITFSVQAVWLFFVFLGGGVAP